MKKKKRKKSEWQSLEDTGLKASGKHDFTLQRKLIWETKTIMNEKDRQMESQKSGLQQ